MSGLFGMILYIDNQKDRLAADTLLDRRRPGRLDDVKQVLIPLLRGSGDSPAPAPQPTPENHFVELDDPLSASRGIVRALIVSAAAWSAMFIGWAIWAFW